MAKTYSPQLVVKALQYVEESTEGTTPTASPSFTAIAAESLDWSISGGMETVNQIATEDPLAIVQGPQNYESTVRFLLPNSTYLKYGLNAANYGTPTGTINAHLSHVYSFYLNGTENYRFLKGSRAKSGSVSGEIGRAIRGEIAWVHTNISTPNSSSGLTTPSFASTPSSAVWTWTDGGTTPVSWNASAIDCTRITVNFNRGTASDHTLGNLDPHSSQPHARSITGSMEVLATATTLEADFKAGTARTLAWVLKSATSTLTLTNTKITSYKQTPLEGSGGEAIKEIIEFEAISGTVT